MLPAPYRLRRQADIRQLYRDGQRWRHPLLVLFVSANDQNVSRFAVSVSRRVGNAVVRNRCKRRVREAIRHQLPHIRHGWDCLFVVRQGLQAAAYGDVQAAVQQLLQRAGLLVEGV